MLKIGVTGGIGSGKSTVTDYFSALGITIVDTDVIAREAVEPGTDCLEKIVEHFGKMMLQDNLTLDRAKLRELIFSRPAEKKWLEQLTHPVIRNVTIARLNAAQSPYVILSSPLLLETGQNALVDRVVVVDVSEEQQLERASLRDDVGAHGIKSIIQNQISRQNRLARTDDIIDNSGDLNSTRKQVEDLHQRYLSML
ncbi:dephospho-CoA kinase [Teredinibacter haidensis]|uniref:dephospho-CoA kinase n=1 Tax=Teredinibacter haidensis TaxID=2731755 RepID=UPI0009488A60|nr:dephospho-CoA kinase [Teredinibacter haidensis]